jgi:FkbM family methyltransferase
MKRLFISGIKKIFKTLGFEIRRIASQATDSTCHAFQHTFQRLHLLKDLGYQFHTICDIGASDGRWSRNCLHIFPNAHYFCVDPLDENQPGLEQLSCENLHVSYWMGCLGSSSGTIMLNAAGAGSSILAGHWGNPYGVQREVRLETLDSLIQQNVCSQPELLKLDVQGYELEVLKGASIALREVQAIIAEVSFFSFQQGMPVFHKVVESLAQYGFVVADIFSLNMRPLDNAAAQADVLFIKSTHPLRHDNRWDHDSVY